LEKSRGNSTALLFCNNHLVKVLPAPLDSRFGDTNKVFGGCDLGHGV
jgi:hypothetical protein